MKDWLEALKSDATPCIDECITVLGDKVEWLHQFKYTEQDSEWHAEGDVHIHTGMVLEELYALLKNEAEHVVGERRQALILGALLHDIAKPCSTKPMEIKGRIRIASPHHETLGRSYLAPILAAMPLSFGVIWQILGMVGEHHMPKLLVVKNQTKGPYLALSRRANCELLYWLEIADMRGRICPDRHIQLQYLDEFKMFAQEYGVWNSAYFPNELIPLISDESKQARRFILMSAITDMQASAISMPEEAIARCYPHKNRYSHLVVLCGPSGSGKSSYAARHYKDYACISLDEIREEINGNRSSQKNPGEVLHLAKDRLKAYLRAKQNVIWDATNLRSDFRKILCDFGFDYHALVTLIVFLHSHKSLKAANSKRTHAVPEIVLSKQLQNFQFPLVDEAHEYIVVDSSRNEALRLPQT